MRAILATWALAIAAILTLGWLHGRARDRRQHQLVLEHLTTTCAQVEQAQYMRLLDHELDDMTGDIR